MGILINKNTKVVVQGITGREGSVRTKYMKSYGTHVVGGTSPGKKGSDVHGVPVYNTVKEIAREHGEIDFSVIFVPGHVLKTAVMEAADAGVKNVIPCVEGTPIHDIMEMIAYCKAKGVSFFKLQFPSIVVSYGMEGEKTVVDELKMVQISKRSNSVTQGDKSVKVSLDLAIYGGVVQDGVEPI